MKIMQNFVRLPGMMRLRNYTLHSRSGITNMWTLKNLLYIYVYVKCKGSNQVAISEALPLFYNLLKLINTLIKNWLVGLINSRSVMKCKLLNARREYSRIYNSRDKHVSFSFHSLKFREILHAVSCRIAYVWVGHHVLYIVDLLS